MPGTSARDICKAGERVRRLVECQIVEFENQRLSVTISCGGSMLSEGELEKDLIHRADEALYFSKEQGRNRVSWHDGATSIPISAVLGQRPGFSGDLEEEAVGAGVGGPPGGEEGHGFEDLKDRLRKRLTSE